MAVMQNVAIFEVLALLGTFFAVAAAVASMVVVAMIGEHRLSRWIATAGGWLFGGHGLIRKVAAAVLALIALYSGTLLGASLASRDRALPAPEEKYFCEIDCHLAYSIAGVEQTKTIAGQSAAGEFLIVRLRTRFDEKTISPGRPPGAYLTPNPRQITLVDDRGRTYGIASAPQDALERFRSGWTPLTTPLRPGEFYFTDLVFDVPAGATGLRLLVTDPTWVERVLIGHEQSPFHGKVYLLLPSVD